MDSNLKPDVQRKRPAPANAQKSRAGGVASLRRRCGRGDAWDRAAEIVAELRATADAAVTTAPPAAPPLQRTAKCPQIVRQELAKALPEICKALTEKVLSGDLAALKQLWTMAELDAKTGEGGTARRDSSFARKAAAFLAR